MLRPRLRPVFLVALALFALLSALANSPALALADADGVPVYRLYNKKTSEHLYTINYGEFRDLPKITKGDWVQEGIAWRAPKSSKTPVYRLYNKKSGDHHYTISKQEANTLVKRHGWTLETTAFYSDDAKGVPLYRLYNGRLRRGQHHYTAAAQERNALTSKYGWVAEGIGWYGLAKKADPTPTPQPDPDPKPESPHTVRFVSQEDGKTRVISEQRLAKGDAIAIPDDPTRERYEFRGWNPEIAPGATCSGDATYEARWAPKTTDESTEEEHRLSDASELVYQEGVGSLEGEVASDGRSAVVPAKQVADYKVGDIVVVNRDDLAGGVALKIESIKTSGGKATITGSMPEMGEVFESIEIHETSEMDASQLVPAAGVKLATGDGRGAGGASGGGAGEKADAEYEITLSGEGGAAKVEFAKPRSYSGPEGYDHIKLDINPTVTFDYSFNWIQGLKDAHLDFRLNAKASGNWEDSISDEMPLFSVPFMGGLVWVDVSLEASLEGKVSFESAASVGAGFAYDNGAFGAVPLDTSGHITVEAAATANLGPVFSANAGIFGFPLVDVGIHTGVGIEGEVALHTNPSLKCTTSSSWWYLNASVSLGADANDPAASGGEMGRWKLIGPKSEFGWCPIYVKNHYEDDELVGSANDVVPTKSLCLWEEGGQIASAHLYDNGEMVVQGHRQHEDGRNVLASWHSGTGWEGLSSVPCSYGKGLPWHSSYVTEGTSGQESHEVASELKAITIQPDLKDAEFPDVAQFAFQDLVGLTSVAGLSNLNTSKVTDMGNMFSGCTSLASLEGLEQWDVSKVESTYFMFNDCTALKSAAPLGAWDASRILGRSGMFQGCTSLVDVAALEAWNPEELLPVLGYDDALMFEGCPAHPSWWPRW